MAWFLTGLRHEAARLAKRHRRLREHELLILEDLLSQNNGNESARFINTIAANSDTVAEVEDNSFLQEALSLLTPDQKKVILVTVLEDATEQKAAKELGISQQAVNRIKKRALNRLRKHFILDKSITE
ncbi:MAG: sigma-70 family RNA polymerase sigma factor [Desulfitobacteriaceae bacterium]|nr:sigma-70 family RNA polymerase sigma factor [Desulfitobacteriaceae bacterium]